jgi:hypothetical protein
MNQKQTSTIIVSLAIALAVLAGVIMTVATIAEQAYAPRPAFTMGDCIKEVVAQGFNHREAAALCRGVYQ